MLHEKASCHIHACAIAKDHEKSEFTALEPVVEEEGLEICRAYHCICIHASHGIGK
jgi:hypothetical protein